jgi:arsenical pump membrane protein
LLACALVANAASFLLPIANPANLVVFGTQMPPLGAWLRHFLLPSAAAVVATYLCLRLLARQALSQTTADAGEARRLSGAGRLALAGIGIAALGLLVSSGLGIPLGAPTCAAGVLAMAMVAIRDRKAPMTAMRNVSWSVVPLVAGLFMIVEALNRAGMLRMSRLCFAWLAAAPDGIGKFWGAGAVALLSNAMNNLPVGLAGGSALRSVGQPGLLTQAVLIGVDLGPNLSVTGSLATILWLIALRRDGAEITAWEFLKVGAVAMPVALVLALLALR